MRIAMIAAAGLIFGAIAVAQEPNTPTDINRKIQLEVVLPDPNLRGTISVEHSIALYDQSRAFLNTPLSDQQISQLTWAANMTMRGLARIQETIKEEKPGRLKGREEVKSLRFPYRLYIFTVNGVFRYDPLRHALTRIVTRDFRLALMNAANKQDALKQAAMTMVIATAAENKASATTRSKFTEYAQSGQIAQAVAMQAAGLGLASLTTNVFEPGIVKQSGEMAAGDEPICMVTVGVPATALRARAQEQRPAARTGKRIAMVVPEKNYSDPELGDILYVTDIADIQSVIVSTTLGPRKGMNLGQATATVTLADMDLRDYDAVIFIGGVGTIDYYNNRFVLDRIRAITEQGLVLGGIGEGATLLANAGVLPADRARTYEQQKQFRLKTGQSSGQTAVQAEAGIVTGAGPADSTLLAREIIRYLRGGEALPAQPQVTRPSTRMRLGTGGGGTTSNY